MGNSYTSDITPEKFEKIRPLRHSVRRRTKPTTVDLYEVFCAVLYLLRTGCQWRFLPSDFLKWRSKAVDASKKVSGIKRHIAVDTQGFAHAVAVTAAEVTDRKGALQTLGRCKRGTGQMQSMPCDSGYTGEPFTQGVRQTLGQEVTMQIARRWVVECSFAWLDKNRRLWKNCERLLYTSLQFVRLAFLGAVLKVQ